MNAHQPRPRWDERLAKRGGVLEFLRLPALLFSALARLRGWLYDRGLLPVARVELPIISVGNLTVGGTGKTPMVALIARELAQRGRRVGLLSRGYKSGSANENDEARVLAELLPDVPHVQDADRVRGAHELARRGVDAIVLDDGFQHRRLGRDLDVVLVDATRPWGLPGEPPLAALLPRGFLREPRAALRRADLIVLTHVEALPADQVERLASTLREHAPGCPLVRARHQPVGLRVHDVNLGGVGERLEEGLAYLDGREVALVSGIGNPTAFEETVRGLGARVIRHHVFPDHHAYTRADLEHAASHPIVTTAKDAVKLLPLGCPCIVVDVELALDDATPLAALLDGLPPSPVLTRRAALHEGLHG